MTPFGKVMRNLRMERGLLLNDLARLLGRSPSYLSAIEFGRKGKPSARFIDDVVEVLDLNDEEKTELVKAAEDSATMLKIKPKLTPLAYQTANEFARKLSSLSEEKLQRIRKEVDS